MLRVRSLGTVPYHEAYALQHALATEAADDYLLVLQHPHTYTLGAHADERHVLVDPAQVGAVLERTDRGGDVTYHGPGQLVAYPDRHGARRPRLGSGARAPPRAGGRLQRWPTSAWRGRPARTGIPGVWLDAGGPVRPQDRGHRGAHPAGRARGAVARSMVWRSTSTTDLAMFGHIVPCGIADRGVTSLAAEGIDVPMEVVVDAFVARAVERLRRGGVERHDVVQRPGRSARCVSNGGAPAPAPAAPGRGGTGGGPRHRAAQADLGAGARADRQGLPSARGDGPRPRARHRVRGGGLPQHLRVLGRRHGDLHDQRRTLHAGVRFLPGGHAPPPPAVARRARPGGAGGRSGLGSATQSSPAWPATICPTAVPGRWRTPSGRSGRAHPGTTVEVLISDCRGDAASLGHDLRGPARRPEPQHRDGGPAATGGAALGRLRAQPGRARPGRDRPAS